MLQKSLLTALLCSAMAVGVAAQSESNTTQENSGTPQDQQNVQVTPMTQTPVYRVNVKQRSASAVDYRHRAGSTTVQMHGTELSPEVRGEAKVNSKAGRLTVDAKLERLRKADTFGPQFLTYVLGAITPEGRATNLGEVLPNDDGKSGLNVTTGLQSFGLIVTAEPYFSVTRPSDVVVAENIVTQNTKGWEQPISTTFEALDRSEYTVDINASQLPATTADRKKVPLELLEARNAVAIAKASKAEQYAPDALRKAEDFLAKGEDYLTRKQGRSAIGTVARYAAQQAEDARVLSIRRQQQERADNERKAMQQRADDESERARLAREQADTAQQQRDQAQQERQAAEQARLQAEQAAQQASQERAAADQARQQAIQEQQNLRQQVQQAQTAAQQAELEREQTRQRLLTQLNQVLQTKDSARGLIVNMSDVLFDFNKATLKPGARERLARVSGIVLAYPDLQLQVEGYTDNVGSDSYNMTLSEKRAAVVRDYLVSQGVNAGNVSARGFGKTAPVASNDSPAGRQMNRRVELVVSGEAIQANGRTSASPAGTPGTTATGTTTNQTYTNSTTTTTQPMTSQPANQPTQPMPSQPATQPNQPMSSPASQPTTMPNSQTPATTSPTATPPPQQ
jgi:outer membrane protein OmpA-like peptidoglycan-associated protein